MQDATQRFGNRVEAYNRFRPRYPQAIVPFLEAHQYLSKGMSIADIGSGTGISSELFLQAGYEVYGIEPNEPMRKKSTQLVNNPLFRALDGTAAATGLPSHSVNAVLAAQSFHWFNNASTRSEWERILKPHGIALLLWNERNTLSPFEKALEAFIIEFGDQYQKIDHRLVTKHTIQEFFHPYTVIHTQFNTEQIFDVIGLTGRLLSSSYMPLPSESKYPTMMTRLESLYQQFQQNNRVIIHYTTQLYICRMSTSMEP